MARGMGKVQKTLKALVSKQFAAELKAMQEPSKWHDSHMLWGLFGAFLAFSLLAAGILMPTVWIAIFALAAAWIFWVLTLLVAFRDFHNVSSRIAATILLSLLAGIVLIGVARYRESPADITGPLSRIETMVREIRTILGTSKQQQSSNPQTKQIPNLPDSAPPRPQLTVTFKVSGSFTESRKEHIIAEMNRSYRYLDNMGLNPPKRMSLLGTAPKKRGLGFMVFNCADGKVSDLDRWQFGIGDRDIDNPEAIRQVYSVYAFSVLLGCTYADDGYWLAAVTLFGKYFAASEGNATGFSGIDKLYDSIWNLRKLYGRELIDAAMISTYRRLWPTGKDETEFNQWFCKRFVHGLFVIDDLHQHVDKISKYLKDQGLYNE